MWIYNGEQFTEDMIGDSVGFVYIITNLINNKQYIGKKLFTKSKSFQKNKKKKRKRVSSDWVDYTGSNDQLNDDIKKGDLVKKEILLLCKSKSELNYMELKYQVQFDVLFQPEQYYNSYIGTRVNRKQLRIKDK